MTTLDEFIASESPEFRKELEELHKRTKIEYKLDELREVLKVTQQEVAQKMGVSQPVVSKLEKRAKDMKIATLARYIDALGGELSIHYSLPTGESKTISIV